MAVGGREEREVKKEDGGTRGRQEEEEDEEGWQRKRMRASDVALYCADVCGKSGSED